MFVREIADGRLAVCSKSGIRTCDSVGKSIHILYPNEYGYGVINVNTIYFPKRMVGKRVRLIVEVLKDGDI